MRALAFSVHVLTACGAALALLALLAATRGDWPLMFLWLGVALVVDAIDGPLARAAECRRGAAALVGRDARPGGGLHDLRVRAGLCGRGRGPDAATPRAIAAAVVIAITGTLYFADREMKTADNFFRGFPAVWNLVVFYLLLLRPAPGRRGRGDRAVRGR